MPDPDPDADFLLGLVVGLVVEVVLVDVVVLDVVVDDDGEEVLDPGAAVVVEPDASGDFAAPDELFGPLHADSAWRGAGDSDPELDDDP
jgi:hypothetical protein